MRYKAIKQKFKFAVVCHGHLDYIMAIFHWRSDAREWKEKTEKHQLSSNPEHRIKYSIIEVKQYWIPETEVNNAFRE